MMNTLKQLFFFTLLISFFTATHVYAQKGVEDGSRFGHGKDSIRCLTNLSLYVEFYKQNNYEDAVRPWKIVYNECPRATKNIYLHGENMITDAIKNTEDQAKKATLLDSLMRLYDKRIKYFDQKGFVLGKKGLALIRYSENTIDNLKQGYEYLKESIEMKGVQSSAAVLVVYFNVSSNLYKNDEMTDEAVLENYTQTLAFVEKRLEQNPNSNRYQKVKEALDKIFENSGAATCENLISLYKPTFNENKEDKALLNKINALLTDSKCTESQLYLDVHIQLNKLEPSADKAHHIAQLFLERENLDKTIEYYKKAIELEEDDKTKAGYYIELASLTFERLEDKITARQYARNAIELDPNNGRPYILIGRMYAQSVNQCGKDDFEKKAVLWAAVDKFAKAKSVDPELSKEAQDYINSYRPRFPNKKNIFFHNLQIGDSYQIGCWINETTTVRASE
jgi:tetratricopeptide (TPR) repeat protein